MGLLGVLGVIYGIGALLLGGHGFGTQQIPHGAVHGKTWLGLQVNDWSDLLFIAAGLLLMVAAPLHWGAKGMSLLVGLVLAAAAVIALVRGNGVFGIFAANGLTELDWGAAGVLLIVLWMLPRIDTHTKRDKTDGATKRRPTQQQRVPVTREPASTHTRWLEDAEEQDRPPLPGATKIDNDKFSVRRPK